MKLTGVNSVAELLSEAVIGRCREALNRHEILVIRNVYLDDESQLAFTRMLGEVFAPGGEEIYKVTFDGVQEPDAQLLKSNFMWHIDGNYPDVPAKIGVLTPRRLAAVGGRTAFADTYAAYANMPESMRRKYEGLRVVHSFEATQRGIDPAPSERQRACWRSMPTHESWLVWHRRDGRCSLVITASADHVVGMGPVESRRLLDQLLVWTTQERFCYAHDWELGDVVVWDNTGMLHRALPFDISSGRRLHRTSVQGDESWA